MKKEHNFFIYLALFALFVGALTVATFLSKADKLLSSHPEASSQYSLQTFTLTDSSTYRDLPAATFFDLASQTKEKGLYTMPEISGEAALAFIARKPVFTLSGDTTTRQLIPDVKENIRLVSTLTDKQVNSQQLNSYGLQNIDTQSTHFYFDQTRCANTPVFGSYIQMHVSKESQIYALSGALAEGETACKENLSIDQTNEKARAAFSKTFGGQPTIRSAEAYIYSPQIFHEAGTLSYLTSYTIVCNENYCHAYFVDRGDGSIRQDYPITTDAKNRLVTRGSIQRREGQAAVSDQEVNKTFDSMGLVWDYYNTAFQRDSFNNGGAQILVKVQTGSTVNAFWDGRSITVFTSVNATDVLAHEFQHGVTQYTAGLAQIPESGALNEGLSDVFAAMIDADDWLMGEESPAKAIRNMQNPGAFGSPDSTVDSKYYCGSQDSGGVHINNGVINKAFYLMSEGGTFRGCTMTGLGRDTAGQIVYKGLSVYLRGKRTAGWKETYSAFNLACNDIHGATSAECLNVKAAMQSTSMDRSNKCNGGVVNSAATCAGGTQPPVPTGSSQPTVGPRPTTVPPPTGSTPTVAPTGPVATTPVPTAPTVPNTPVPTSTVPAPTTGTQYPTAVPTPGQITLKQAPLLSVLSSPKFISGDVKITKSGTETTVTANLEAARLQEFKSLGLTFGGVELEIAGRLIGEDVLEAGSFIDYGSTISNVFKTSNDLSGYLSYQVYYKKSKDYAEIPVLLADINQKTDSPTQPGQPDQPTNQTIVDLAIRFQGINRKPPATQAQLVRVGLSGGSIDGIIYKKAVFTPDDNGVWHGRVVFQDVGVITDGAIRIKGPRHSQKKYCDQKPTEKNPGENLCEESTIVLRTGVNTLDFTGVYQLAGDVNQDGRVNSVDINTIRSLIGSTAANDLQVGDLNNDGVINSIDDGLVIYTLSNRTQQ